MNDEARDKRIMLMIEVWYYLTSRGTVWPSVKAFLERKLNEELGE